MKVEQFHGWKVSIAQALELQKELATRVSRTNEIATPRFIAGADISVRKELGMATGAVVVMEYPGFKLVETQVVNGRLDFPYVPGLLSFRESPLILEACEKLAITPDVLMVDGQGIAHPRRIGLASHLGLFLNIPTIGCAKSRLCGTHLLPGIETGDYTELEDGGEVIGVALRTRRGVKPVYVSTGHKVDLQSAIYWVLRCGRGYRLPEPTRLAHQLAVGSLRREIGAVMQTAG